MAIKQLSVLMSVDTTKGECGKAPAFKVTVAVTLEADNAGGMYNVQVWDNDRGWPDTLLEDKLNIAYPAGPGFNFQQHPLTLDCTADCKVKGTKGNSGETKTEIYAYVKEIGGNGKTAETSKVTVECVPAKKEGEDGDSESSE